MHDCATFGAACAHGYGFKKGGLKTLLETYAARTNKDDEDGTASSNGPSGKATVSGIDATKDAAQQQAHQRSSSVYNVMKSMCQRINEIQENNFFFLQKDLSRANLLPQRGHNNLLKCPACFSKIWRAPTCLLAPLPLVCAISSLFKRLPLLLLAEPPQPKSVLLKMQNSARAKRIALIEAVATFNSLVDGSTRKFCSPKK